MKESRFPTKPQPRTPTHSTKLPDRRFRVTKQPAQNESGRCLISSWWSADTGPGVVRFNSATHWLPEGDEGGEAIAKVAPTISFEPDCDCGECGIAFIADKKMAATLRNVADLIDAIPIDRRQHRMTLHAA
jgi:hypothetical protein